MALKARWRRVLWRALKWPLLAGIAGVALLLVPVAYVELACRGDGGSAQAYTPLITDPPSQRREANTYLTYPEWHIVYAYDGIAETLKTGDEHAFDYVPGIAGFWRSACALMEVADAHGGADVGTRATIHTIGVSFTVEMAIKAAYEESIGRMTAWWRGPIKTPQDRVVAEMAADYGSFLRQTPWYEYPFGREAGDLWHAPVDGLIRGWERRLGIGAEFMAKAAYAKVLAGAAAASPATLTIHSVVSGIDAKALAALPDVTIVGERGGGIEIDTPRYDRFTRILAAIAMQGGSIDEIAGNDDIMVTMTVPGEGLPRIAHGTIILRMTRNGFGGERVIVDVKVKELATLLRAYPVGDPGIEHVFDY